MPMKAKRVRLDDVTIEAVSEVAEENHKSFAEIVRMCVSGQLALYLSKIKYVDHDQGEEILKAVNRTANELEQIVSEIRRIGVNYNQEIRLQNIRKKIEEKESEPTQGMMSLVNKKREELAQLRTQQDSILKEKGSLNKSELVKLVKYANGIVKKFGEDVCRIVG